MESSRNNVIVRSMLVILMYYLFILALTFLRRSQACWSMFPACLYTFCYSNQDLRREIYALFIISGEGRNREGLIQYHLLVAAKCPSWTDRHNLVASYSTRCGIRLRNRSEAHLTF